MHSRICETGLFTHVTQTMSRVALEGYNPLQKDYRPLKSLIGLYYIHKTVSRQSDYRIDIQGIMM